MIHIDLFSGIGGASIAVDEVFGRENVTHIFCDNEPFAQTILRKHWPEAEIIKDIRAFTANPGSPQFGGLSSSEREALSKIGSGSPVILTGGFPCQPFSQAGRRKGTNDDRHLWPEMLRVIREFRPEWVIGENVAGLLSIEQGMVFEQVCADLEAEGYEVQAFVIPAVAVNAPHRRDRVWIVAHSTSVGDRRESSEVHKEDGGQRGTQYGELNDADTITPHAEHNGGTRTEETGANSGTQSEGEAGKELSINEPSGGDSIRSEEIGRDNASDTTKNEGLERSAGQSEKNRNYGRTSDSGRSEWDENWIEVATELCIVDDGLPNGLVRPKGWRNAALKGAGNAWVPQVAIEILKGIKEIMV